MFQAIKNSYASFKSKFVEKQNIIKRQIREIFQKKLDASTIEELEEVLFSADLGSIVVDKLINHVKAVYKKNPNIDSDGLISSMKREIVELSPQDDDGKLASVSPMVMLLLGTNGQGKTTTTGKLAKRYIDEGKKVLLGACDTFRAAAIEQLEIVAKSTGADIVKGSVGADPASIAFDAIKAGKSRGYDVVLIDTGGRLHSKTDLMAELQKISKACGKAHEGAPHEVLLILDGTTGQNSIEQGKIFNRYSKLSGIILTKLDGTAKGGSAIAIQNELKIPIKWIGIGESMDDLEKFDVEKFVEMLF